eukprot:6555711-Lingulodinium_polyedra.AAC.1
MLHNDAVAAAVRRHGGSHFARGAYTMRTAKTAVRMVYAPRAECEPLWRRTATASITKAAGVMHEKCNVWKASEHALRKHCQRETLSATKL